MLSLAICGCDRFAQYFRSKLSIVRRERLMSASDHSDHVDSVLAAWRDALPGHDVSGLAVTARAERLAALASVELEESLEAHGISRASFDVLATLRLAKGEAVPQRELVRRVLRTPGTMSVRLRRLERHGLLERRPVRGDRRGVMVALTDKGRELVDAVAPDHLADASRLLAGLDEQERQELALLLRKLLGGLEEPLEQGPRLGVALAPAHQAIAMRRAVGLPDRVGLLVRRVRRESAGAAAGLREGDLIVGASGRDVRTVGDLQRALSRAQSVTLRVVRGVDGGAGQVALA
jgi:DNA-binding MarR family transcriptional regulator